MTTDDLRAAAKCVYLATEEKVAQDISRKLNWAADEIISLRERLAIDNKEGNTSKRCEDCVEMPDDGTCDKCGGSFLTTKNAFMPTSLSICKICGGVGFVYAGYEDGDGKPCKECNDTGEQKG